LPFIDLLLSLPRAQHSFSSTRLLLLIAHCTPLRRRRTTSPFDKPVLSDRPRPPAFSNRTLSRTRLKFSPSTAGSPPPIIRGATKNATRSTTPGLERGARQMSPAPQSATFDHPRSPNFRITPSSAISVGVCCPRRSLRPRRRSAPVLAPPLTLPSPGSPALSIAAGKLAPRVDTSAAWSIITRAGFAPALDSPAGQPRIIRHHRARPHHHRVRLAPPSMHYRARFLRADPPRIAARRRDSPVERPQSRASKSRTAAQRVNLRDKALDHPPAFRLQGHRPVGGDFPRG